MINDSRTASRSQTRVRVRGARAQISLVNALMQLDAVFERRFPPPAGGAGAGPPAYAEHDPDGDEEDPLDPDEAEAEGPGR